MKPIQFLSFNTAMLCIRPLIVRGVLFGAMAFALNACEAARPTPPRTIALEQAKVITVDQYFSTYLYGPSLRLYHYQEDNVILTLRFSNRQSPIQFTAALHEFASTLSTKQIAKWVNNQHSDALYGDAPEPEKTTNIQDRVKITSTIKSTKNPIQGRTGESYDDYKITFRVRPIETKNSRLAGFTDTATVHVRRQP